MSDPFSMPPPPPPENPSNGLSNFVSGIQGRLNQGTSESRAVHSLPPSVQHAVSQMDPNSQNAFFFEYEGKKKKVPVGIVLVFLIGLHNLYLKKTGRQFLFWLALSTVGLGVIWAIVDICRMKKLVMSANEVVAREILQTLAIGDQFRRSNP